MTEQKHLATAYGLIIESELSLPELINATNNQVDVRVIYGQVPQHIEQPLSGNPWYEVAKREFLLRVDGIAKYYVKDGETLIIEPDQNASEKDIRALLYKTVFSQLLFQRELLVLHGSAATIDGKGIVFLGQSGIGKTSLALHLYQRESMILTDELCAIKIANHEARIVPGIPELHVWKDMLEKSDIDIAQCEVVREGINKYAFDVKGRFSQEPVKVSTLVVLSNHNREDMKWSPVHGVEKYNAIMKNLYKLDICEYGGLKGQTFMNATLLANSTHIYELGFNHRVHSPSTLYDYISKELNKHE